MSSASITSLSPSVIVFVSRAATLSAKICSLICVSVILSVSDAGIHISAAMLLRALSLSSGEDIRYSETSKSAGTSNGLSTPLPSASVTVVAILSHKPLVASSILLSSPSGLSLEGSVTSGQVSDPSAFLRAGSTST